MSRLGVPPGPGQGAWRTIRRGLRVTPEIYRGLWLTLLLAVAAASGRIVVPVVIRHAIDAGVTVDAVTHAVGVGAVAVFVAGTCSWAMNRRLVRASEAALATLRAKAFAHVHRLSALTLGRERTGSLVARLTSDVDTISQFTQSGGVTLLISLLQVAVATVIMFTYSWPLALVVLLCFFPAAIGMRLAQRRVALAYRAVRVRVGEMYGVLGETVTGADVVRSYGIAEHSQRRVAASVGAVRDAQIRALRPLSASFSVGELVGGIVTASLVVIGVVTTTATYRDSAFVGWFGTVTLGQLVAFLYLVTFFSRPIQQSVEILNEAQNAVAGWRRVLEILDTPVTIAAPANPRPLPPGPIRIEVRAVTFRYPTGPRVLHDLDVEIPAGQRVAIVGATGSGKSTFAKLLTRQLDPGSGQIRFNGVDLRDLDPAALSRRVAIVPQDAFLFDTTVGANITLARPDVTEVQLRQALAELDLLDWVQTLVEGLDTPVGQRGEALSAGERQLVALARTYLVEPDLLVLDEATSAVDPATDVRLQRALHRLTRGRTTVTIAHRMVTAELADQVLVFDAGRIVERGTHQELVERDGVYAALYRTWAGSTAARSDT